MSSGPEPAPGGNYTDDHHYAGARRAFHGAASAFYLSLFSARPTLDPRGRARPWAVAPRDTAPVRPLGQSAWRLLSGSGDLPVLDLNPSLRTLPARPAAGGRHHAN